MNWHLFFSIFALIFIAELPDKTAFATLLLATRSRATPVFVGAALAFLVQTLVATVFGSLIALLPAPWVHLGTGWMFFFFAWQMWRSRFETEEDVEAEVAGEPPSRAARLASFWGGAWNAFLIIFIAEWGDLTQLATGSLVAKYPADRIAVFTASVLALWSVTLVAVLLGRNAKHIINPTAIKKYGAVLFAVIGLYFVFTAARTLLGVG